MTERLRKRIKIVKQKVGILNHNIKAGLVAFHVVVEYIHKGVG